MPPLVRPKQKRYAAPVDPVPWWEGVVAYLILVPGVILWMVGLPVFLGLWGCAGSDNVACLGVDELLETTGDQAAIVRTAALCYFVALVAMIVVQLAVGRLHFAIVWTVALLVPVLSVLGYGIMSGGIGTPWGKLYALAAATSALGGT
jgi:hypothetical protein